MRLLQILLALALCQSLAITAFAHPGRTDSNGGHTNHSTGEYHYHHGQPEHQHYDMNGDGYADCPYDFNGNTTYSAPITKTPSKTVTITPSTGRSEEKEIVQPAPTPTVQASKPTNKEALKIGDAEYLYLYAGIGVVIFALIGIVKSLRE